VSIESSVQLLVIICIGCSFKVKHIQNSEKYFSLVIMSYEQDFFFRIINKAKAL